MSLTGAGTGIAHAFSGEERFDSELLGLIDECQTFHTNFEEAQVCFARSSMLHRIFTFMEEVVAVLVKKALSDNENQKRDI
jgi:hypothetical protein